MLHGNDGFQQDGEGALKGRTGKFPVRAWLLALLLCTAAAALSFAYLDLPIARALYGLFGPAQVLGKGFASAILLGIEAAVTLTLVTIRITRGRLSPFQEATGLACLTSICGYGINDGILKLVFGVPNPVAVMEGARHVFDFFHGTSSSSFPSGHMILAGTFAGVFMRLYPSSVRPLGALLLLAVVLLVGGDWHFLSDVIAGTFLGLSGGLLAGEVWLAHSKRS